MELSTVTPLTGVKCSVTPGGSDKSALFVFPDCCVELIQGDEPDGEVHPRQE